MSGNTQSVHQDSAQVLHDLIVDMKDAMRTGFGDGNELRVHPLFSTMEKIAHVLEYDDYITFLRAFMSLCDKVEGDLNLISFKREGLRSRYRGCLDDIRSVFNAENFQTKTFQVFGNHFSDVNMAALIEISDRYEAAEVKESSLEELTASLSTAEELLDIVNSAGLLDDRLMRVIAVHMDHLQSIIAHYQKFGEREFWDNYKILFATFSQLIGRLNDDDVPTFGPKLRDMLNHIVLGTSLAANAVTIGGPFVGMISG